MFSYLIEDAVFELCPGFRRGVIVATAIDNSQISRVVGDLLAQSLAAVSDTPSDTELQQVAAWNHAYTRFGANPDKYTPSVRFLHDQVRRGKPPRRINTIVDLMNDTSLKWKVPCGGDSLEAIAGADIVLGIARGNETFAPLFKPHAFESPLVGEVIYYTPQTKRIMCRRWTWRNADFSKITPETRAVAINIDALQPFPDTALLNAVVRLSDLVKEHCGGEITTHILDSTKPSATIFV